MKAVILSAGTARAVELIDREQVSRFACVPTMSAELLRQRQDGQHTALAAHNRPGAASRESGGRDWARVPHAMPGTGFGMMKQVAQASVCAASPICKTRKPLAPKPPLIKCG